MNLEHWHLIRQRYEDWWEGKPARRPMIQLTAPRPGFTAEPMPEEETALIAWHTEPELVLPRLERSLAATAYYLDAFPLVFPVSPGLPAIEAAYLGCEYRFTRQTAWLHPRYQSLRDRPPIQIDPDNFWWRATQNLLNAAAERWDERYAIGIPDLQGGGHIAAEMRGMQNFALDLLDCPQEAAALIEEVNHAWLHYYTACFEIIHTRTPGWVDWLGIWSEKPAVTVECDFAAMISPKMFERFFLPALEQQVRWVERTIFHLDGPQQLPHLELLLSLPELDGIQWVPGAGAAPMQEWIPLLRRIQAAGKRVVIACDPAELPLLLRELDAQGLLIAVNCASLEQAERLAEGVI